MWSVRGLNRCARRTAVRELARSENVSLLCLQETKLDVVTRDLILDMLGLDFDYFALPAVHTRGGILVAWNTNVWLVSSPIFVSHSILVKVTMLSSPTQYWWLTTVYGQQEDEHKVAFLQELRSARASMDGPWALCGDFNLIYQDADKNNGRLSKRMMGRF